MLSYRYQKFPVPGQLGHFTGFQIATGAEPQRSSFYFALGLAMIKLMNRSQVWPGYHDSYKNRMLGKLKDCIDILGNRNPFTINLKQFNNLIDQASKGYVKEFAKFIENSVESNNRDFIETCDVGARALFILAMANKTDEIMNICSFCPFNLETENRYLTELVRGLGIKIRIIMDNEYKDFTYDQQEQLLLVLYRSENDIYFDLTHSSMAEVDTTAAQPANSTGFPFFLADSNARSYPNQGPSINAPIVQESKSEDNLPPPISPEGNMVGKASTLGKNLEPRNKALGPPIAPGGKMAGKALTPDGNLAPRNKALGPPIAPGGNMAGKIPALGENLEPRNKALSPPIAPGGKMVGKASTPDGNLAPRNKALGPPIAPGGNMAGKTPSPSGNFASGNIPPPLISPEDNMADKASTPDGNLESRNNALGPFIAPGGNMARKIPPPSENLAPRNKALSLPIAPGGNMARKIPPPGENFAPENKAIPPPVLGVNEPINLSIPGEKMAPRFGVGCNARKAREECSIECSDHFICDTCRKYHFQSNPNSCPWQGCKSYSPEEKYLLSKL